MVSSLCQNDRDNRDISSILEGPWRVTDDLIKMVQYLQLSFEGRSTLVRSTDFSHDFARIWRLNVLL
jgi:hypothetical protein